MFGSEGNAITVFPWRGTVQRPVIFGAIFIVWFLRRPAKWDDLAYEGLANVTATVNGVNQQLRLY